MNPWRDSAVPPTDAEIAAFKAQGVVGLCGYFKFDRSGNIVVGTALSGDNIYYGWPDERFQAVKAAGLRTLAFCSGYDDPNWVRPRAARLGIQAWLDDEPGIRPVGGWEQAWVNDASAGQYGNGYVHVGVVAPLGHIFAGYFGYDPKTTWPLWVPRPNGPLGWQWIGTHNEQGLSVDDDWFDDAIGMMAFGAAGGAFATVDYKNVHDAIQFWLWGTIDTSAKSLADFTWALQHGTSLQAIVDGWKQNPQYAAWQAKLAQLAQGSPTKTASGLSADDEKRLTEIDSLLAIANALKGELDQVQAKLNKDLA